MNSPIVITVNGDPKAQPRARSFILRGKGGRPILDKNGNPILRVHEAGSAEFWKSQVAEVAQPFVPMPPLQGPLRMDIEFRFRRPQYHYRSNGQLKPIAPSFHITKPDRDNLEKAITDSLKVLGMFKDDCQVCAGEISKIYGERPGATIKITTLEHAAPKLARETNLALFS